MKTEIVLKGINNLDLLKKALLQYSNHIGPKKLPSELIPFGYPKNDSISVADCTKKLPTVINDLDSLNPVSLERRLEFLSKTADCNIEEIKTDHFGLTYNATSFTYSSKNSHYPEGRMILYKQTLMQKLNKKTFHPSFTFELIGFDQNMNHKISVGITVYKNKNETIWIYSSFEEGVGASIDIGSLSCLPGFRKRLIEVFELDK